MNAKLAPCLRSTPEPAHLGVSAAAFKVDLGKRWEIDAKVAEMTARGWIFLRGLEASPLFMFRARGGGLTLHFIQPYDS